MKFFSIVFSGFLLFSIFLPSCREEDYSLQVKVLDSLTVQVDSALARLEKVPVDSTAAIIDSVEKHLQYVQQNYVGQMRKDMAEHLSNYRSIKKLAPDIHKRVEEAKVEAERTLIQLRGLKKAMTDGSTHDAQSHELTPEYVGQLFTSERESAENLIWEMNLISERSVIIEERFNEFYPQVRFWVDSIPMNTKTTSSLN